MGKKVCTIPFEYSDTPERRAVSLEEDGIHCVPVLEHCRFAAAKPNAGMHRHPGCLEIICCLRGSLSFECEDGSHVSILPGQVLVIPPHISHHLITNQRGLSSYGLFFRLDKSGSALHLPRLESQLLKEKLRQIPFRPMTCPEDVKSDFQGLFEIYSNEPKGPFRSLQLRAKVLNLLLTLSSTAERQVDDTAASFQQKVLALASEMKEKPENNYTSMEISARLKLSATLVIRAFKKLVGLPPHAFLLSCRLEKGLKELRETKRSVTEIAAGLQFYSSQHFSTQFSRCYGITPLEARRGLEPVTKRYSSTL